MNCGPLSYSRDFLIHIILRLLTRKVYSRKLFSRRLEIIDSRTVASMLSEMRPMVSHHFWIYLREGYSSCTISPKTLSFALKKSSTSKYNFGFVVNDDDVVELAKLD